MPAKLCAAFLAAFTSCIKYPSGDTSDFVGFDKREVAGLLAPNEDLMLEMKAAAGDRSVDQGTRVSEEQWSSLELEIRQAFSAISGTPAGSITRDTSIYRIGLDSISAIQVAGRLRKQGLSLTAGDILESASCSKLASVVQSRTTTPIKQTPAFNLEDFDRRYRTSILTGLSSQHAELSTIRPCTAVQSGMLSQYLQSGGEQYLNHVFYGLDNDVDADRLATAWAGVMENHEMLRTGFCSTDDGNHPFAMLTYASVDSISTRVSIESSDKATTTFSERQQAASSRIWEDLYFPPWRWDVFNYGETRCLQFSAHHALFDAETLRLIQDDLRQALIGGEVPSREPIDSALSLIIASSSAELEEQKKFWAQRLQDVTVTKFPYLTPVRVADQEPVVISAICATTRSQMEARCRDIGTSLQAAGQAAWARVLAAYTGEPHVTFGVVYSGRTASETASCAFPCITTLPMAINTAEPDDQILNSLTTYNAMVQRHQFTPLTDIQRYAGSPGEALFDTLFAYQKPLGESSASASWNIVHETATVDYPISIEMEALAHDQLSFRLTVHPHQVPVPQGHIILHQLEALLDGLLDPSTEMGDSNLSIVPAKDPFISTNVQYLHEFFTSSVIRDPHGVAMEFVSDIEDGQVVSRKWTYAQLDQESNRIAQLLVYNGVQPNSVVATSFDKCPEASFAFLGILKAGCAFCAIDPTAPTARKAFILQDSNARLLLTEGNVLSELRDVVTCKIIDLSDKSASVGLSDQPVTTPNLSPSSVSYVLYTSGTTGTPKGCELTHDNAVQALLAFQRLFQGRWSQDSRWLQFASYHFDVSVLEQFWTWSVGIRLVCAPRDLILEDLAGFIHTMGITHLDLTPSLGRLLDPALVPSLHQGVFITGGEALKQDMIDAWGDIGCLFNFYGPTECTIGVTTFPSVPKCGKPSNIGWQFDNVGSVVLAPGTHQPVLRGAIGELCISGRLVGKGYLNRPELTEDRFPYVDAFGERVYRTGDLVRLLHDESIEFLGRQDNQVKLRGQRLEIDEIEAVVRQCREIQDVVCLVAKHPKQQKDLLVGFIALSSLRKQGEPRACPAESTLELIKIARTSCEEHLPGYMVPTHFIPVEVIPLSVNNKVEEKQLRNLYGSLSTSAIQENSIQSQDAHPLNDIEKSIARILASLLNIDATDLRPSSNIFALGLSSISAIQFSRKLKAEGFDGAQVAIVMKYATIGKLATALSTTPKQDSGEVTTAKQYMTVYQQRFMGFAVRTLGGHQEDYEAIAPCTPLQQGVISRSFSTDTSLYFNSFRYSFEQVDTDRLRIAFQTAVDMTQVLRTNFIETDDGYVQVIKTKTTLPWFQLDFPTLDDLEKGLDQRKTEWRASNTQHLIAPFEVVLAKTPQVTVLTIHIHHALYDGVSYQLLLDNIQAAYLGQSGDFGRKFTDVLPYGPLRHVKGAKEFWLDHLAGAKRVFMPALSDEVQNDTLYYASSDLLSGADELRRTLNVTLQAVIQAAWVASLRRYYQGSIGTVVSGRSIDFDGAETVLGPLFNTVPFNPLLGSQDSWQSLVHHCHDFNISALPFQHTSLRDIMKWCKARPSEPLFDTLFVFQSLDPSGVTEQHLFVPEADTAFQADYPLAFEA